jgi:hypothetical protein
VLPQKNRRTRNRSTTGWPAGHGDIDQTTVIAAVDPARSAAAGRADTVLSNVTRPHQHARRDLLDPLDHHTRQVRQEHIRPLTITQRPSPQTAAAPDSGHTQLITQPWTEPQI